MRTQDDHLEELYGLPVLTFPVPGATAKLPEPDAVAWRIGHERWTCGEPWQDTFGRFCAEVDLTRVRALIVGIWDDPEDTDPSEVVEALAAVRDRLPALRSVFLGDITDKECKLSRISQTDVTPLLAGFPELEELGVRAGEGTSGGEDLRLRFPALRHDALRRLVVQSSGLPADAVRGVGASSLPALEHLELWLGDEEYGADCEVADLEPILSGARLPRLRHLALRNSAIQDEVAAAVATAPVVDRLDVLDLSLGTLGDDGARALLGGRPLTHLKKLDLHYNFLSEPARERIRRALAPAGVELDLGQDEAKGYEEDDGTVRREICVGPVSY
ncbi:STM4015 family protein [Streptomyces sp. NPDC056161]|uniref:STM4015 family protein n=1 Tax=Streptomyces sp. NPDC056161 TaxID=3345732 RepID=UPI0035D6C3FF